MPFPRTVRQCLVTWDVPGKQKQKCFKRVSMDLFTMGTRPSGRIWGEMAGFISLDSSVKTMPNPPPCSGGTCLPQDDSNRASQKSRLACTQHCKKRAILLPVQEGHGQRCPSSMAVPRRTCTSGRMTEYR